MQSKKKKVPNKANTVPESKKAQTSNNATSVKNEAKEPVVEETAEEKEEKIKIIYKEKEKTLFSKVLNIVLWVILFTWMAICLVDFFKVSQEKEPIFCIKKEIKVYDDGNVKSCLGLGYKVYKYNRASYNAIEFGPFWSQDKSVKEEK